MLEGEVRDDIRKLERDAFVLHVLDGEKHLRHDILARAGIGGLRINDFRIVLVAPWIVGGRRCGCRRCCLRDARRVTAVNESSLLRHPMRIVDNAGVEVLQLLLEMRHAC